MDVNSFTYVDLVREDQQLSRMADYVKMIPEPIGFFLVSWDYFQLMQWSLLTWSNMEERDSGEN